MRVIKGFEKYNIDEDGIITNIKSKRDVKLTEYNGYLISKIRNNEKGVMVWVHKLVAENFLENPMNLTKIRHKDGN